jgi:DNA polymerase-3 subunit delta'
MAKEQAKKESEIQNEVELIKLKESYGTTGTRLANGGNKAVKDLEKKQNDRQKQKIKSSINFALLEIVNHHTSIIHCNLKNNLALNKEQKIKLAEENEIKELIFIINLLSQIENVNSNTYLQLLTESIFCDLIQ